MFRIFQDEEDRRQENEKPLYGKSGNELPHSKVAEKIC
jgi:hypothetical protein